MNTTKPKKVTQSFYLLIDQYPSVVLFLDLLWFVMKSMQNWPETQHSQELNSSICSNHCLSRHTALTPHQGCTGICLGISCFSRHFSAFVAAPHPVLQEPVSLIGTRCTKKHSDWWRGWMWPHVASLPGWTHRHQNFNQILLCVIPVGR